MKKAMATYREIQAYVKAQYDFVPKTCWIAHAKEIAGLDVEPAWKRQSSKRQVPCPPDKVKPILVAFRHFKML